MKRYKVTVTKSDGTVFSCEVEKVEINGNILGLKEYFKPLIEGEDFSSMHAMPFISNVAIVPID